MKVKKKKTDYIFTLTMTIMPILAVISILVGFFQLRRIQNGILDICATQQDAYVELVLDQINLNSGRNDDEIISDILETLDASSNKYWTFSSDQTMLFVKDVIETNKYKGFTTATYYVSDSAQEFINSLRVNRVTHANIVIEGKDYIASGVTFSYRDNTYRLCLLTNREVLLDNNSFLGAKTEYWILLLAMAGIMLVIPMLMAIYMRRMQSKALETELALQEMDKNLLRANQRLSEKDLHDTKTNLWSEDAYPQFIKKLAERGAQDITLMRIKCEDAQARDEFLRAASITLDRRVLRFGAGESDVLLIYVGIGYSVACASIAPLMGDKVHLEKAIAAGDALSVTDAAKEMV